MNKQKIALFTPNGETGKRFAEEALKRGHSVTAIVNNTKEFDLKHPNLKVEQGDITRKDVVARCAKGHDVVVCAHTPALSDPRAHVDVTHNIIAGAKEAGVQHIVSAAHAIEQKMDNTQEFYNAFNPVIEAQRESLKLFQKERDLSWSYLHSVNPSLGQKPGEYNFSSEIMLTNPTGQSRIAAREYTKSVLDEVEMGQLETHELRQRRN